MQQTFTLNTDIHLISKSETTVLRFETDSDTKEEPSEFTIQNILNFSKNLEVKKSETIGTFDYLKS